jgi:hypothetical protein
MLQIVETRIISVIAYYHLAFFAISMAMLGLTGGSLVVHLRQDTFSPDHVFENLAWIAAALAVSVCITTISLITTIVGSGIANTFLMTAVLWFKLALILLPPYVFAGMAISLALTRTSLPVGRVYATDLVGAAAGCLLTLPLLGSTDAISALFAIAALASVASILFGAARRSMNKTNSSLRAFGWIGRGIWPTVLAITFGSIALWNAFSQPTTLGKPAVGLVLLMAKDQLELRPPAIVRWNSYSRIVASIEKLGPPVLWGPSPLAPTEPVSFRGLNIDGSAATLIYRFTGDTSKVGFLKFDVTNLAYTIRHTGRSAIIGVGGGRDILSAYFFGFRDITGIELNPIFVDLLSHEYRRYAGLVDLPGVRLIVDDARSWFARTQDRFDLIEMSLVDTWAATGAGAFSLSENGLYTTRGWHYFLGALSPNGVFTVSRWFNPEDVTETGRLLSLAAQSLRNEGVADPRSHIFLAASSKLATLIVARSAFTPAELRLLRQKTSALHFTVLLSPDASGSTNVLAEIVRARSSQSLARLTRQRHLDLSVTTDERPFFFMQLAAFDPSSMALALRNDDGIVHGNLLATLTLTIIVISSSILVVFTALSPTLSSVQHTSIGLARAGSAYFLLIGLGFMFIEIGLIQRLSIFLGHPVYGVAIGLFGIILSTGAGSLLSERIRSISGYALQLWALILACYLALLPLWFSPLLNRFESGSLLIRALASLGAIVPPGILMGFGFPFGMRIVNAIDRRPTPWFWAVNGGAGVLAAGVAVATSIVFSINVSLWIGASCYLLTWPVGQRLVTLSRVFPAGSTAATTEA